MTTPATTSDDVVVRRVLQRVILPADADVDVLPLYVDNERSASVSSTESSSTSTETVTEMVAPGAVARPENIIDRHRVRVPAGTRVSFGTYFNAFAASYWRRWTVVKSVVRRQTVAPSGSTPRVRLTIRPVGSASS